jgi:hypothetical protein
LKIKCLSQLEVIHQNGQGYTQSWQATWRFFFFNSFPSFNSYCLPYFSWNFFTSSFLLHDVVLAKRSDLLKSKPWLTCAQDSLSVLRVSHTHRERERRVDARHTNKLLLREKFTTIWEPRRACVYVCVSLA